MMLSRHLRFAVVACLLAAPGLHGQDDFFGSIDVDVDAPEAGQWSLFGWVTEEVGYGLQSPGAPFSRRDSELNSLETSLFGQFDWRINESTSLRASAKAYHDEIYRVHDSVPFSTDEINEFRNRYEVRDLYVEHQADNGVYIKAGKQIQAWGYGEYLRVTDLVNVEDRYTIGQQDLQDLRLQVPALQLSYNFGGWLLDAVITYEAGRDYMAPAGDEFDPFIELRQAGAVLDWQDPAQETEVFLRASGQHGHGDFQFVVADFNDNALSVERLSDLQSGSPKMLLGQNRMQAVAAAANWVEGNWLFFGEVGLHMDKAVRPWDSQLLNYADGWDERDQVLGLAGLEYNGLRNLVLTLEADNIHTRGHNEFMAASGNEFSYGGRVYWTTLNDRVSLLAVWNQFGDDSARVWRLSLNYDWTDNLNFGLLWVDYDAEPDSLFFPYRHNDMLQLQARFSFQYQD